MLNGTHIRKTFSAERIPYSECRNSLSGKNWFEILVRFLFPRKIEQWKIFGSDNSIKPFPACLIEISFKIFTMHGRIFLEISIEKDNFNIQTTLNLGLIGNKLFSSNCFYQGCKFQDWFLNQAISITQYFC